MRARSSRQKVLLAGWFSLEDGGATFGDTAALDVVKEWLSDAGVDFDVALTPSIGAGVDWRSVAPSEYSSVVLVCGPVSPRLATWQIVSRFSACRLVAVDVSVVDDPAAYSAFAAVIARDGAESPLPDLAFAAPVAPVPIVGVLSVHAQVEYAEGRHEEVDRLVSERLAARSVVALPIGTRFDANPLGLRSVDELAAVVRSCDAVVTTRLHGLVFALKLGVPAVAVDPIAGGAKVAAQAAAVGWPYAVTADEVDDERLDALLDACLTRDARELAVACADRATADIDAVRTEFLARVR